MEGKGKGVKRKVVEVDADGCTSRIATLVNGLECIIRENDDFYEIIPTNGVIFFDAFMVVAAKGIPDVLKLKREKALTFSFPSVGIFLEKRNSVKGVRRAFRGFNEANFKLNQYYWEAFEEAYKSSFGSTPKKYQYTTDEQLHNTMLGVYIEYGSKLEEKPKVEAHTPMIEVCLDADRGIRTGLYDNIYFTLAKAFRQKRKIDWMCKKSDMESCLVMASQSKKKNTWTQLDMYGEYVQVSSDDDPEEIAKKCLVKYL